MTEDEIDDLIEEWDLTLDVEERLPRIDQLLEELLSGAAGRTAALTYRGEILQILDRPAAAVAAFELAAEEGGSSTIDPRALLLDTLFRLGRDDDAAALLTELRAASAAGDVRGTLHSWVGDCLEERGDLRQAQRWFNLGLRDLDPELDDPDFDEQECLVGRLRVRQTLSLPKDRYDLLAADVLARRRQSLPDHE